MLFAAGAASATDEPTTRPAEVTLPAAERYGSVWDVLLRGEGHDRFLELADRVGLRRVLDGEHPVTVFAPSDAAFEAVDEGEMAELLTPRRPAEAAGAGRGARPVGRDAERRRAGAC